MMRSMRILTGIALMLILAAALSPSARAEFGVQPGSFEADVRDSSGAVQNPAPAGGHPAIQHINFELNATTQHEYPGGPATEAGSLGGPDPDENVKTTVVELPPGMLGNPTALPRCSIVDFAPPAGTGASRCPSNTQVGLAYPDTGLISGQAHGSGPSPLYNLKPPKGVVARLGFFYVFPIIIDISVRSEGNYGLNATTESIGQGANVYGARIDLWGVPADPSHDASRFVRGSTFEAGVASDQPLVPFLSNPTRCGVDLPARLRVASWKNPTNFVSVDSEPMQFRGCDRLDFEPSIEAAPTTNLADAPSGFDFHLHLPQNETLAQNEVQSLKILANEGNFNLEFEGQKSEIPIPASEFMPGRELQSFLEIFFPALAGNVTVTGGPADATGSSPYLIKFVGKFAHKDVEELKVIDSNLSINTGSETVPGDAFISTVTPGTGAGEEGSESTTAHLRDAIVTLPEGMTINPPSAAVLDACSLEQVGMSPAGVANSQVPSCPDASILGKAVVDSPPIDHPLPATLYLARQNENPFNSLFAMYLVIDDEDSGLLIKLPGKIEADPRTGQLTVSFRESPQTPVEDIEMHLFPGPHASLKTPEACGVQTVTSELVPWTAPEGETKKPTSSFALTRGPDGGACPATGAGAPNKPAFIAGTSDPTAKAYAPFSLRLSREDGSQPLKGIETTLPPGLLAKLAGTTSCSEDDIHKAEQRSSGRLEQSSPSCPDSSRVGTVTVAAGAGSTPLYVSANAYLAGPYKGAPLSLVVIVPAVAGPFDLGNVVVRNALYIDPITSQARAVSDPFPTIIKGIPLDLRSVTLKLDRPQFTLNPTSCEPMAVTGSATSIFNQSAALSSYFQSDECGALGFKPQLKLALKGSVKRSSFPSLKATLTARPGDANIASAQVRLPHAAFLAQSHLKTICTRVQFAARTCPAGSIYGKAEATSPLLDYAVKGPVYLRSSFHKLPDLVAELRGPDTQPIMVELSGKTDSVKGALRNTFEAVPDVPVTRFSLTLFGGKKGLIEMSGGFCKQPKATVVFGAHNGAEYDSTPKVSGKCGKPKGKKHAKRGR